MTIMSLEQRVDLLERSARRWRRIAVGAFIAAAGAVALGLGAGGGQVAELIQARRLEIVGPAGTPVLTLTQNEAGGILATQTQTGEILVTITATATGEGVVALADRQRRRLVELAGRPGEGVGVINTFSDTGHVAVSLLASRGAGQVQTFHGEHPTAMIGGPRGEGIVAVFDAEGRAKETLPPADR